MRIRTLQWTPEDGWRPGPPQADPGAGLVIVFGAPGPLAADGPLGDLVRAYPGVPLAGCSTAGEIAGASILDGSLTATVVAFETTTVRAVLAEAGEHGDDEALGRALTGALPHEGLRHVLVFADGLCINGSQLVRGLRAGLPDGVTVTGGLAGDGRLFAKTWVLHEGRPRSGGIAGLGFYGPNLRVGFGSLGGWVPFGPERLITSSRGNVLYEMDGTSALTLYKQYLGPHAQGLPATGQRFPLSIRADGSDQRVVRTVRGVDEHEQSMTFAGDVPEGAFARLMTANTTRLVDGAAEAARACPRDAELAILVSCVGRRMLMGHAAEDELEAVRDNLGRDAVMTGFYSYGEIAPCIGGRQCQFHNQTMTITTLREE